MIEKDNIQELFSKAFENQTTPVKPALWSGVQAKMAAAGVGGATAAVKGVSALTKWIIGSAAVTTIGVVSSVVILSTPTILPNHSEKTSISQPKARKPVVSIASNLKSTELPAQSADWNLDLSIFKDTSLFKPFCLLGKPLDIAAVDTTASSIINVLPETELVTTNGTKNDSVPSKRFPENTSEPVHAVLVSKVTKFPNFFSPNGDFKNDTYTLDFENKDQIVSFEFIVFNQRNEIVYRTQNPDFVWDGTNIYTAERISDGMYFCLVNIIDQSGSKIQDKQLMEVRTSDY